MQIYHDARLEDTEAGAQWLIIINLNSEDIYLNYSANFNYNYFLIRLNTYQKQLILSNIIMRIFL